MITQYGKKFDFDKLMHSLMLAFKDYKVPIVTLMAVQGKSPFKILISTILSARTKDDVTAAASERLYNSADSPKQLASLDTNTIENLIFPVGFYKVKAARIKAAAQKLLDDFDGNVPDNMDDLMKIDGVGRKTANLVLGEAFSKQAICVDVHVHRISNRLGLIKTSTPLDSEMSLRKILPPEHWIRYNTYLVAHGQHICKPVSPFCSKCSISALCKKMNVARSR